MTTAPSSTTLAELTECLRGRRSVRQLTDDALPDASIRELVALASWAPSGGNDQPWEVTAVSPERARTVREKIERRAWRALVPKMSMVVEAIEGRRRPAEEAAPRVLDKIEAEGVSRGSPWLLLVHQRAADVDPARVREFHAALRARFGDVDVPSLKEMMEMNGPVNEEVGFGSVMCFTFAMTLAARARGLATCIQHSWLAFKEDVAKEVDAPSGAPIRSALLLGVPDLGSRAVIEAASSTSIRSIVSGL